MNQNMDTKLAIALRDRINLNYTWDEQFLTILEECYNDLDDDNDYSLDVG